MKRHPGISIVALATIALVLAAQWLCTLAAAGQSPSSGPPGPKYIFIFLADGAGIPHMEITRKYNRVVYNEGLVITDKIMKQGTLGLLTVHAADSLSTDSAAAATALASGCKAKVGALGICDDGTIPKTALEMAKEKGMRIGLVTNSTIYDASPAAFAGHVSNRRYFNLIIDQYLRLGVDLLLNDERDQFLPQKQPGSTRKDDNDMIAAFIRQGYTYASDKLELSRAKGSKLFGLFSLQEMSFELDRDKDKEPSLTEMTQAAIRFLEEGNQRGFMLFKLGRVRVPVLAHFTREGCVGEFALGVSEPLLQLLDPTCAFIAIIRSGEILFSSELKAAQVFGSRAGNSTRYNSTAAYSGKNPRSSTSTRNL